VASRKHSRRSQRGINLISVIVATLIMSVAGLAVLGALSTSFHSARSAEPKAVAQTTVSNVQTDLNAMAMYDPSVITRLGTMPSGASTSITHPAAAAGATYMPADTQPTKITLERITTSGTSAQLVVNYQVPSGSTNGVALTGNSTVTITQKAPNGCDPMLTGVTLPNGTRC
jgi:Tfp pilus assembly protein PilV